MYDYLITNCVYPDFDAGEMKRGNVAIVDGRIAKVTDCAAGLEAKNVIDAEGKVLSPGFIDIHMHEESFVGDGERYTTSERMLSMGVTTCVGGNCGVTRQPLKHFKSVLDKLGGCPVNYVMLAGYNMARRAQGLGNHDGATVEQIDAAIELVREDLEEGASGISFGIEYDPAMTTEEALRVVDAFPDNELLVSIHYRDDGEEGLDAIREMIEIGDKTGKRLEISHLSSCSALGQMDRALKIIDEAMARNPKISFDTYPYNAFSTTIGSTVFEPDCFEHWGTDPSCVFLCEGENAGKFCDMELFTYERENHPDAHVVCFVMNEEEIASAVAHESGMVGSDGGVTKDAGHPRVSGTFPRVLGKYVREEKRLPLILALEKMTCRPAARVGLEGRKGAIKEGFDADLTLFDPEVIIDCATFQSSMLPPKGIECVFVDGKLALDHGEAKDLRAGRFIPYVK